MAASELMSLRVSTELFAKVRACAHRLSLSQNREVRWTTFVRETLARAVHHVEQELDGPDQDGFIVRPM